MTRALALLPLTVLLLGCPPAEPQGQKLPLPPSVPSTSPPAPSAPASSAAPPAEALLKPSLATATAPATFKVSFETSKGPFVVEVTRAWAPQGADRFYNLVQIGYFTNVRFFRVLKGFMAQFGINGDPQVNAQWQTARIPDDPVTQSNRIGMLTFATAGPNTRTTQLFINVADNANLDRMGFAPFGKVVSGMEAVHALYGGYGEGAPRGRGPDQGRMQSEGNPYLEQQFPKLDYVKSATLVE